jgi:hypothetical protein
MTTTDAITAIRESDTYEAAWEVLRAVLIGVTQQTNTLAEYDAAWAEFAGRYAAEYAKRGSAASYHGPGARSGSNWAGD